MIQARYLVMLLGLFCCELFCCSVEGQPVNWRRGRDLNRQTQMEVSGRWAEAPLQPLLLQLSRQLKIPLFIDRRVDPSLPITLNARNLTWDQFLFELGEPHGLGFCRLEGIYYFGPRDVAYSLPQSFEKLSGWVKQHRKSSAVNWRRHVSGDWSRLSQPRELLQALVNDFELEVFELEQIPFDLWGEHMSPSIPLVLHTALLAVGFDRWIAISKSGKKLKIVPYPLRDSSRYEVSKIEDPKATANRLKSKYPDVNFQAGKRSVAIGGSGPQLDQAIKEAIFAQRPFKTAASKVTFNGDLRGSRMSLLQAVAAQLGVELDVPDEYQEALGKFIELSVKDLTGEQIVGEVLKSSEFDFQMETGRLRVIKRQ